MPCRWGRGSAGRRAVACSNRPRRSWTDHHALATAIFDEVPESLVLGLDAPPISPGEPASIFVDHWTRKGHMAIGIARFTRDAARAIRVALILAGVQLSRLE